MPTSDDLVVVFEARLDLLFILKRSESMLKRNSPIMLMWLYLFLVLFCFNLYSTADIDESSSQETCGGEI